MELSHENIPWERNPIGKNLSFHNEVHFDLSDLKMRFSLLNKVKHSLTFKGYRLLVNRTKNTEQKHFHIESHCDLDLSSTDLKNRKYSSNQGESFYEISSKWVK